MPPPIKRTATMAMIVTIRPFLGFLGTSTSGVMLAVAGAPSEGTVVSSVTEMVGSVWKVAGGVELELVGDSELVAPGCVG